MAGGVVSATLDILILPREPAPGWAHLSAEDEFAAIRASELNGGPPVVLAALVTDDDEGALPPLLAVDRVHLASAEAAAPPARSIAAAAANELAPFVSAQWDPASRERLFCCAGGAVHAVTLTWLSAVEGAVDDEDEEPTGGPGSEGQLSLPAVVTLMDSRETLLGVAPVGDPLAEGLLLAVDAAGRSFGLHPAPPLPADGGDGDAGAEHDAAAASAAAARRRHPRNFARSRAVSAARHPRRPRTRLDFDRERRRGTRRSPPRWRVSASAIFGTRTGYTRRRGDTPFVSAPNFGDSARRRRRFERD